MNQEVMRRSAKTPELEGAINRPNIGDLALVKLNDHIKLLYISDVSTPDELPESVQTDMRINRGDFQIVYNNFDERHKSKTPIYDALTSLAPGEKTSFPVRHDKTELQHELELLDFWNYEQKDVAINLLNKALDQELGTLYVPRR